MLSGWQYNGGAIVEQFLWDGGCVGTILQEI
jgi:hypothetical protein